MLFNASCNGVPLRVHAPVVVRQILFENSYVVVAQESKIEVMISKDVIVLFELSDVLMRLSAINKRDWREEVSSPHLIQIGELEVVIFTAFELPYVSTKGNLLEDPR